jgi:hypothetical protein
MRTPARAAPDDRLGLAPRRLGTTAGVGVVGCSGGGAPLAAADARELGRGGDPPATTRWCSALGRGGVSVRLAALAALVGCDGGRGRRRLRPSPTNSAVAAPLGLPGRACARGHGGGSVRLASTVVLVSASTWWSQHEPSGGAVGRRCRRGSRDRRARAETAALSIAGIDRRSHSRPHVATLLTARGFIARSTSGRAAGRRLRSWRCSPLLSWWCSSLRWLHKRRAGAGVDRQPPPDNWSREAGAGPQMNAVLTPSGGRRVR